MATIRLRTLFPHTIINDIDMYMGIRQIFSKWHQRLTWYDFNNNCHRSYHPPEINIDECKTIEEIWYWHGTLTRCPRTLNKQHHPQCNRCDPSIVQYYSNGTIETEEWYYPSYGLHRINDAPSYIEYYPCGKIKSVEWYYKGQPHRKKYPAFISYYENGTIKSEIW